MTYRITTETIFKHPRKGLVMTGGEPEIRTIYRVMAGTTVLATTEDRALAEQILAEEIEVYGWREG